MILRHVLIGAFFTMAGLVSLLMLGFGVSLFVVVQRRGMFVGILRFLERVRLGASWFQKREQQLQALDDAIPTRRLGEGAVDENDRG